MLWGGRQSSCFTSSIVPLAEASTTNKRVPSLRERRTVTLIASGATAGVARLTAADCGCIHQMELLRILEFDFKRIEGGGTESAERVQRG
jgi:hypothetical protein